MAKQKISITLDEEKLRLIEILLKDSRFRNRSHIIEYSLNKLIKEIGGQNLIV